MHLFIVFLNFNTDKFYFKSYLTKMILYTYLHLENIFFFENINL